jgi:hypothetical protein
VALGALVAAGAWAMLAPVYPAFGRTQALETTIVSGVAKPRTSESGKKQRWHRSDLSVHLDESLDELGGSARQIVMEAFDTWAASQSELPRLVFEGRADAGALLRPDGKNTILRAAIELEGHTEDLAVTITFSDAVTGEIIESDIVLNARAKLADLDQPAEGSRLHGASSCEGENAELDCESAYDLKSVLTHEIGHFFGLAEDASDGAATMFACTNPCETHKRELSPADQTAMSDLYPEGSLRTDEAQSSSGCGARTAGAAD